MLRRSPDLTCISEQASLWSESSHDPEQHQDWGVFIGEITESLTGVLSQMRNLEDLRLDELFRETSRINLYYHDLQPLKVLNKLVLLSLAAYRGTHDDIIEFLKSLSELKILDLSMVRNLEFKTFPGYSPDTFLPSLRKLYLPFTALSRPSFQTIAQLPKLETLDLSMTLLTPEFLSIIAKSKSLKSLSLYACTLSSQYKMRFDELTNLQSLDVERTSFSRFESLQSLFNLKTVIITLEPAAPPPRAIISLKEALPDLSIVAKKP